jgi:ABC-type nitrate/sulfonate/bicarbonate transport system permease component
VGSEDGERPVTATTPHPTLTPPIGVSAIPKSEIRAAALGRLARTLGSLLVSLVVVLALWEGFIRFYHIQPIIAKSPIDVYRYMFTQRVDKVHGYRSAAANRTVLFHNLKTTIRDASLGYVAGIVLAMAVACIFVLQRTVERTFLPITMTLRTVPLIALTPMIVLIFGRSILAVSVIGGIVCFFPALVNIMLGLRATPKSALDLMASYGASKLTVMRKVLIPSALPSIFAALRINVPASVIGALLAEWLATGKGSGFEMLTVQNTFDYGELWAAVVLVTLISIVMYSIVSAIETGVLTRYAPDSIARKN